MTLWTTPLPLHITVSPPPHAEVYEHFPLARHGSPIFGSLAGQAPEHADAETAQYDFDALHVALALPHGEVSEHVTGPSHGSPAFGGAPGHALPQVGILPDQPEAVQTIV